MQFAYPIRLFKKNANTEVTADIIFLQKRETLRLDNPDWCYVVPFETSPNGEQLFINSYFTDNPQLILGKMAVKSSRYGYETVCEEVLDIPLKEKLSEAVKNINATVNIKRTEVKSLEENGVFKASAEIRNFTYGLVDGKLYYRSGDSMELVVEGKTKLDRMIGLHNIRTSLRNLIDYQIKNNNDEKIKELQADLNQKYDNFSENFGRIYSKENENVFSKDDDYNLLCSLEVEDSETKTIKKADIFSQRTIRATVNIEKANSLQEAYQICLDRLGKINIEFIANLLSKEPFEVLENLKKQDLIYKNPLTADDENELFGYEETSEYLSGNIREKLITARLSAKGNIEYERNVAALKKTLPPPLEAQDISVRLGASWIDLQDYEKFLSHLAKRNVAIFSKRLRRNQFGEYKITDKGVDRSNSSISEFGTSRMNMYYVLEKLLNQRDIVVKDKKTTPDGKEYYEINKKETQLAVDKARKIKEEFKKWLWNDPERRKKYTTRYNEIFNSIVGRKYDGSHQTFEGMNSNIELNKHQKDAIARAKYGGNTLLAHCVGAGKSFEMFASVMEKKRLGLISKACIVVPKNLVGQTALEWQRLYPNAKIFAANEKDFQKDNRQKFQARCVTGNYDGIIMSYEQFGKIPMSQTYRENFIRDELKLIEIMNDETGEQNRATQKDIERKKKLLEKRLTKLVEGAAKSKDSPLDFEQFGFDYIVVDEAHNFKNGLVISKMNNVSGVSTQPAQKSEDILMKCNYFNDKFGCKNILFATGTPVSNSMSELYVMQNYLRPDIFMKTGIENFDDWAANFGEVVTQLELKPAGDGFRTKKRFAKFTNLPELMSLFKEFADIKMPEDLNLPVPELRTGKPQVVVAKPTEFQKEYMQKLAKRAEDISRGNVDLKKDNMLVITSEARHLGLDQRAIDPTLPNDPRSKLNLCIENILSIYENTAEQKGVQAVFCDIGISEDDGRFSIYESLKDELIKSGIPENEICFAGDAKNIKQRNNMYSELRNGDKRVVIASTSKMGTGANIQTRLCAMHHLDTPWRPSDLEQRNGRIIRQFNTFSDVDIFNYVTEGTFDAYMLNIITTKQKFISQLILFSRTVNYHKPQLLINLF